MPAIRAKKRTEPLPRESRVVGAQLKALSAAVEDARRALAEAEAALRKAKRIAAKVTRHSRDLAVGARVTRHSRDLRS